MINIFKTLWNQHFPKVPFSFIKKMFNEKTLLKSSDVHTAFIASVHFYYFTQSLSILFPVDKVVKKKARDYVEKEASTRELLKREEDSSQTTYQHALNHG